MTPIDQTKMASTVPGPGARSVGHPLKQALWVFLAALLAVSVLAPRAHAAACGQNVSIHYGGTGFDDLNFNLISVKETDQHSLQLTTGYFTIDPEKIVIPFTQEVAVTFFYEDALYKNDFGWMLADSECINSKGIGINCIKHLIYEKINDAPWPAIGDGILDGYEGKGTDFRANRKVIGTFEGGTEIVFYMHVFQTLQDGGKDFYLFTRKDWNPDIYGWSMPSPPWTPYRIDTGECKESLWNGFNKPEKTQFTKTLNLGLAWSLPNFPYDEPGNCMLTSNWMAAKALNRVKLAPPAGFGLDFTGATATMLITLGQRFPHVVAAVSTNQPNEWVLGWEDYYGGGDMDYNDFLFHIERRTGGHVQLKNPVTPAGTEGAFTAVNAQVWDRIPCPGKTELKYYVSIDNGANWVAITQWDEIWESDAAKTKIKKLASSILTPGTPEYTWRTVRLDFAGLGITGRELTWKAEIMSNKAGCEPEILDVQLDADIPSPACPDPCQGASRAAPVVKANVIYSGYYESVQTTQQGHLSATRLYAPDNPNATAELALWDAGTMLKNRLATDLRTIYFPQITNSTKSNMQIATGNGTTKIFTGTISPAPISATTLTITGPETFHDKYNGVLEGSLGGTGTINRFTGVYSLTFNTAPTNGASITASYTYYTAASALLPFVATNITKATMGLDDRRIEPSGLVYDFDNNGSVNNNDAHWLMNWVRGYELGSTTVKRPWLLDAIDHSMPALETAPGLPMWYFFSTTTQEDRDSYDAFRNEKADRDAVIYAGSRSGMLHAFDAGKFRYGDNSKTPVKENRGYFEWTGSTQDTADYGTGRELWAFIPANLLPRLKNNLLARLNRPGGDAADQAYVDASPALADVYINGAWRTVLLSAEGNGGDTVFCLDVTDQGKQPLGVTDPIPPKFLWEFSDPGLFRSRSSPSVARIVRNGTAKWVAFFVSGNPDPTQFPSVYMIDIATGVVLERVFLNAEHDGIGGVPSGQPTIVDSDGNGYLDRFYIGTDKGFLYKVNISDDPASVDYAISHCVVNRDYKEEDSKDVNGNTITGNTIASAWRYQTIYGSPVVVVDNDIVGGNLNYNVKIFYGTGPSPYAAEGIDTRYHFLAYVDTAEKGVCSDAAVYLDWYYKLPEHYRVFASAFTAAGMIYFGTSTAATDDPCATGSNTGEIFAFDTNAPRNIVGVVDPKWQMIVGNTVTPPLVEDQHLYIKSGGLQSFGAGVYNNKVITGGSPHIKVKMWREIF